MKRLLFAFVIVTTLLVVVAAPAFARDPFQPLVPQGQQGSGTSSTTTSGSNGSTSTSQNSSPNSNTTTAPATESAPNTGFDTRSWIMLAAVLLLAGLGCVWMARLWGPLPVRN